MGKIINFIKLEKRGWNLFLSALIIFSVWSCTPSKDVEPPENLLPKEKMVLVLKDIVNLESKIKVMKFPKDTASQVYEVLEEEIWKSHNIKEEDFKTSHQYYLVEMEEYEGIFKSLVDSLGLQQSKMEAERSKKAKPQNMSKKKN